MITSPMVTVKMMIMGAMMLALQHMPEEDSARGGAHGPGCQKIVILFDSDHGTSRDSRAADATGNPQDEDDLQLALTDQRHHRNQNEQPREGHPGVDKPLHHHIELAAEEPGSRADQQRYHQVDAGCGQADDDRNARPVEDSAQQVSPQLIGTQQVFPRRRAQPVYHVGLTHREGRQDVGEDAAEEQQQHDDAAKGAQRLLPDKLREEVKESGASFLLLTHSAPWGPGKRR